MPREHTRQHVKVETDPGETSGSDTAHEGMKAGPETGEIQDAGEVGKNAEQTPAADEARRLAESPPGHVADAGDAGAGQASPYGTEAQADALARQAGRTGEPRDAEKPKRG